MPRLSLVSLRTLRLARHGLARRASRARASVLLPLIAASWAALAACSGGDGPVIPEPGDDNDDGIAPIAIPARGNASTFDVATWNIEWFGDAGNGPNDENLQLARVRDVIRGADLELWGVQEIVDGAHFARLVDSLPGYAGLLANASSVQNGPSYYNDFGGNEQKVGIIYRSSAVEVLGARIVLTDANHEFAGRPPLEVRIRATIGGASIEGYVLVLHAKASTDLESWQRRTDAAAAMKAYLDAERANDRVWVIGDFNDDLDTSIRSGAATPYGVFLADRGAWRFVTETLTTQGISSMTSYPDIIDHQLVSDEVLGGYVDGSAEAFRVDTWIPQYDATTSDHFPVIARYRLN